MIGRVAATPPVVFVEKRKRPDGRGLWPAYEVGNDEFGTWLYTPQRSLFRGEANGEVAFCNVGNPVGPGRHVLSLIPADDWWIATFWPPDRELGFTVTLDVCTPPTKVGDVWTYIDLELDPWIDLQGEAHIQDEDEFEHACREGWIPGHEATAARDVADRMCTQLSAGTEPFGAIGRAFLAELTQQGLPPLRVTQL
jgi:hypothetical protein